MDISDIVHGFPKENKRKKEASSRDPTEGPSSSHNRHATPPGSSASHARSRQKDKSGDSHDFSSPYTPKPSSVGDQSGSSSRLQCDSCERTFDSKTKFEQHCRVFHGRSKAPSKPRDAPFTCPDCGKAFTSPSKRNVHQDATHKGLRPFQCQVCSKSFGYKGGMPQHKVILSASVMRGTERTNLYEFASTLKSLRLVLDLTKHMATHSGVKDHSCYICGARFARNFYVKRHIETVHEKKGARKKT